MIQTITIQGGLTAAVADIAHFGDVQIERLPDETVEAFKQRAHDLARGAGATRLCSAACRK
jgi:hypothetical protein